MGKSRKSSHERDDLQDTQTAALIWLGFAFVVGALLFIAYYMQKMKSKKKTSNQIGVGTIGGNVGEPTGAVQAEMAGGRRRPRTARQRMVRRRQYDDEEDEFFDEDFDDEEGGAQIPWSDDQSAGKVGTKKLRKIQEKAEKKVQREEELQEREDRKKREQLKEEERKREVERQKMMQEQEDEEERLKKEEQEQKEHEEYLMLKESFTVEESGETGVISEEESQTLLQEFIDYIVETKVVMLEDLAAQFGLRVQDTIKRLEDLQEAGRLTGVMDDRGKFISISEEELNNVARFIKQRGRVAISDLAESSNTLISMKGNSSTLKNGKQIRTVEASA